MMFVMCVFLSKPRSLGRGWVSLASDLASAVAAGLLAVGRIHSTVSSKPVEVTWDIVGHCPVQFDFRNFARKHGRMRKLYNYK